MKEPHFEKDKLRVWPWGQNVVGLSDLLPRFEFYWRQINSLSLTYLLNLNLQDPDWFWSENLFLYSLNYRGGGCNSLINI